MKYLKILSICILFSSCASIDLSQVDWNDDYGINLKSADIGINIFDCNCMKFGKNKENSETFYHIELVVEVEDLKSNGVIDFNNFSLIDLSNKIRHRAQSAYYNTAFTAYSTKRIDLKDYQGEDLFLKYQIKDYKNFDHYFIKPNKTLTGLSERSSRTRFEKNLVQSLGRQIVKNKIFKLVFYTKQQVEGNFILYYKDKIIREFNANRELIKFENN